MKFSFITKFFIPKEKILFSLFNLTAGNIVEGSEQLRKLLSSDSINDRKSIALIVKSIKQKGDDYTDKIINELNSTYISSLDNEFVQELTSALNNVLHLINALSEKTDLYTVTSISHYMKEYL